MLQEGRNWKSAVLLAQGCVVSLVQKYIKMKKLGEFEDNIFFNERKMFMKKMVFKSKLLPDGHLFCPDEVVQKKNAHFKVTVTFEETEFEAAEHEVELSAIKDASEDFLSKEELNYYLNLKDL